MNKSTGILFLLIYVCGVTALLNENFLGTSSLNLLIQSSSLFAIVGIGAAFVIITGGIDLSIGSMVALVGCVFGMIINASIGKEPGEYTSNVVWMLGLNTIAWGVLWIIVAAWERVLNARPLKLVKPILVNAIGIGLLIASQPIGSSSIPVWGMWMTICAASILLALQLGLIHGILITKLRLQPFVVTLCGLMIYRGLARWLSRDRTIGFGDENLESLRLVGTGKPCTIAFLLLVVGSLIAIYCLFTSINNLLRKRYANLLFSGILLVLGVSLAVSGGSRYFDGWTINEGPTLFEIGGYRFGSWEVQLGGPDANEKTQLTAAARPSVYLKNFGMYGGIASLVLLVGLTIRYFITAENGQARKKFIAPLIATVFCGVCLIAVQQAKIIGSKGYSLADFESDFGVLASLNMNELWYARFKMLFVMTSLALLIGSIAWLVRSLRRSCGPLIKGPMVALGAFALMWWIGQEAPELQKAMVTVPFLVMTAIAAVGWVVLNKTVYGRYLLALGRNEEAARFSGIDTDKMVLIAYVICSGITGIFAILFALYTNSVQPSEFGNFIELYAIAAAVLGGCSLRGGEGAIVGVVIGASIMQILKASLTLIGIPGELDFMMIGIVILLGALVDELVRRIIAKRRTIESYAETEPDSTASSES